MMRAALISLCLAGAAAAQERPVITPTRDVDVTYRAGAVEQRMRWLAAEQRLRIDPPGSDLYMLVDYHARRMQMVRPSDQKVVDLPTPATLPGQPPAGRYARGGAASVAGLACTEWQTRDAAGDPATVCFTPDGVMLRAVRGGAVLVEAQRVAYGPQDAALFRIPPGYATIAPPALPP